MADQQYSTQAPIFTVEPERTGWDTATMVIGGVWLLFPILAAIAVAQTPETQPMLVGAGLVAATLVAGLIGISTHRTWLTRLLWVPPVLEVIGDLTIGYALSAALMLGILMAVPALTNEVRIARNRTKATEAQNIFSSLPPSRCRHCQAPVAPSIRFCGACGLDQRHVAASPVHQANTVVNSSPFS